MIGMPCSECLGQADGDGATVPNGVWVSRNADIGSCKHCATLKNLILRLITETQMFTVVMCSVTCCLCGIFS